MMSRLKRALKPSKKDSSKPQKIALFKDPEKYNNVILQYIPSGVIVVNMAGVVTSCNPSAGSILNIDCAKAINRSIADALKNNRDIAKIFENGFKGETYYREQLRVKVDGSAKWIGITTSILYDDKATPMGVIALFSDITDVKELEAEMKLKERLAAIGELSAGLAHEIRNPLSAIMGYTELLKRELYKEADMSIVDGIIRETQNLNAIVSEFLNFVRKTEPTFKETDPNLLIKEVMDAISVDKAGERIRFIIRMPEHLPMIEADPSGLRMALINIIQNAIQAMPGGGRLTVKAGIQYGMLYIEIADTGLGISAEIGDRIFNPFFTTKEQGTGLGLAIVHKIIESHDGKIEFKSKKGKGTAFIIRLPISRIQGFKGSRG